MHFHSVNYPRLAPTLLLMYHRTMQYVHTELSPDNTAQHSIQTARITAAVTTQGRETDGEHEGKDDQNEDEAASLKNLLCYGHLFTF